MKPLHKIGMVVVIAVIATGSIVWLYQLALLRPVQPLEGPELPADVGTVEFANFTVLIDNYPHGSLNNPWGLSIHIETDNASILFDTGPDHMALQENSEALGINLSTIDCVVISHEHWDHVGGLIYVAQITQNLPVYIPEYMNSYVKSEISNLGFNVIELNTSTTILPGIAVLGQLHGPPYEQALAINVRDVGLVVVAGCSHPGIEHFVARITPYLIIGGFHLHSANQTVIRQTVEALIRRGAQTICPIHCSGDQIRNYLETNYPEYYLEGHVGFQFLVAETLLPLPIH